MSYTIELIPRQEQTTSKWSGGTTTQIAIFPKQAVYAERNFTWRISSACVDVEQSEFTSLPGIWRLIMVLDGEMRLEHTGHHSSHLKAFEQDSFSGDWTTTSFGKVRDFNVMLANGSTGTLTAHRLSPQASLSLTAPTAESEYSPQTTSAFYCVDEIVTVTIANEEYQLATGDMLLLTSRQPASPLAIRLRNTTNTPIHIVKADINYR
ncbi:MAG: HutD [Firmicutes bacterium]|nr:HutD [Bacillota bacterium]